MKTIQNEKVFNRHFSIYKPTVGQPTLFLSLLEYQNRLLMSKDFTKVLEFFSYFESAGELVKWMRLRPVGNCLVEEVGGTKEVIVVICTPSFDNKFVKHCVEEIYAGLHIVLVGGEGYGNKFVNIAHNFNLGINVALKYDPKWVVISSDDMVKIDDVSLLVGELNKVNNKEVDVVFTSPSKYHSMPVRFAKQTILRRLLFKFTLARREQLKLESKFNVTYFPSPRNKLMSLFFKRGLDYISIADFGIFSSQFIKSKEGSFFDESCPTGGFDDDVSILIRKSNRSFCMIQYRIGDLMGSTLGNDASRKLRDLVGLIYLNEKYDQI